MRLIFKGTPGLPEYRGWHDGRFVRVVAGGVLEVEDAASLLKDFPGIFVPAEAEVKAIDAPPVDKMLRRGRTK